MSECQDYSQQRPHVVLLAIPAPGHAIPFLALAKLLAGSGIQVTYVGTGQISEKLQHDLEIGTEELDIRFGTIVEEPVPEPDHPDNLGPWLQKFGNEEMVRLAEKFIKSLTPPPCCMITDIYIPWLGIVAKNLELPRHFMCTMSAASLAFVLSVPHYQDQGLLPLESSSHSTDIVVPGVGVIRPPDVWEYFRVPETDSSKSVSDCFRNLAEAAATSTILLNTFQELELPTIEALQDPDAFFVEVGNVVPIGPLLPSFAIQSGTDSSDEVIDSERNSKKLSSDIGKWLDYQPPNSVLYISFGSIFSPNPEQIREIAYGIEASKQRFLWVLRPPESPQVVVSKQSFTDEICNLLPPGFEKRTRARGLLINSWAPQLQILAHKATGLFLSHCGWNSTLEAIGAVTPLLACPCFTDQWMNARWLVDQARCGKMLQDAEGNYERGTIERAIRSMLQGEEGRAARSRIADLNRLVERALSPKGSSKQNLHEYVAALHSLNTGPRQSTDSKQLDME